jgi:hypothetical protein
LLLAGVGAFAGGFASGYFMRKKLCEVKIEEVSEDELNKLVEEMKATIPEEGEKTPGYGIDNSTVVQDLGASMSNEEKEAYFKKWTQYDTKSEMPPEKDIMALKREDFKIDEDEDETENTEDDSEEEAEQQDNDDKLPTIEGKTMEEWRYSLNRPDGEYDTIELKWFAEDDIVCDEDEKPLQNAERYLGFDVEEMFRILPDDLSGDSDVRIVLNRKTKSMYYIERIGTSYRWKRKREEFGADGYDDESDEDVYDRFHR